MNTVSSSSNNPFKLQGDNKKFFTSILNLQQQLQTVPQFSSYQNGLNRIKNMNKQLQILAKKREQMLFKDSQIDYIFKKQKPNLTINDFITNVPQNTQKQIKQQKDKQFRVRSLLKEKKQSIHDFLQKKKQIYLSKMNINIKKQETIKLSDYIKDQQETLKARKLYFDNDVQFMHKFIQGIKKQAEQAQSAVQAQLKTQQILVSKLNSLQAQTQKLDNLISKDMQTLNNLKTYKQFIDSFYDQQRNWKAFVKKVSQNDQVMFMTENMSGLNSYKNIQQHSSSQLIIKYQPENLLQIFTNAQQNNIREIQNLHDKQDQFETITKQQNQFKISIDRIIEQNQNKIKQLIKKYQQKHQHSIRLKQLKKNNSSNKINILDGENLDIQKISSKIYQIYQEIQSNSKKQTQQPAQKGVKKAMAMIQHDIQKLRQSINSLKQLHPQLILQIQKQIKQNQKKQNIIRKQQQAKLLQIKKQKQQQKKRNQPQFERLKGRKDMQKVLIEKKVKKKKQVDTKIDNDQEKYLNYDDEKQEHKNHQYQ